MSLLLAPFGIYHSFSEASVMGSLWGYHLPIGYLGLTAGLLVVTYPKTELTKKVSFAALLIVIGVLLIVTQALTSEKYFAGLIHGTTSNTAAIDIDYPFGNWLVWGLVLASVVGGLMLKIRKNGEAHKR
jgi:hypothetical protein